MRFDGLEAGVYRLTKNNKKYGLERDRDFFITPKKLYGRMGIRAEYFWNSFVAAPASMGVLLTGTSGGGKSVLTEVIANIGINNLMPVVLVREITADLELIKFISDLSNVIIIFDEFAKVINGPLQNKSLSMLSDVYNKKLFLMTENNSDIISPFIRNRPGRVRYHIDYGRLEEEVFEEYCADFDMDSKFLDELREKYKRSAVFSFDHLSAIVTEHISHKDQTLDELLFLLNLDILSKPPKVIFESAYDTVNEKELELNSYSDKLKEFNRGMNIYLYPKGIGDAIVFSAKDIVDMNDDKIIIMNDKKIKIILRKE